MTQKDMRDVIIIGGGIVGTAIARELSKYKLRVLLLEKEPDLGAGTTKANSGIVHAGYDAKPDTVKARLNVQGNKLFHELEEELDFEVKWLGSLVVASNLDELKILEGLLRRGQENGVPGIKLVGQAELLQREPNLANDLVGGLWAPSAGVISPFGAALAFAENAAQNGVQIITECLVESLVLTRNQITVKTTQGEFAARYVINAAGLFADDIGRLAGDNSFEIKPRKGEYILFDKISPAVVGTVVFPTPSAVSKGILVSPTVHGNLFIGPNSEATGQKHDLATTSASMSQIIAGAQKMVPHIPLKAAITQFSGLRATAGDDFIIRPSTVNHRLIHVAGIQSPGLSSAPAIAVLVKDILRDEGLELAANRAFVPCNPRRRLFRDYSKQEQQAIVARSPLHGRVICRCEMVTEGDIVAAIKGPCGAKTLDGIKRRTRAGMGRCQGGFCGPRVTGILARELGIPVTAVRKDTVCSYLFLNRFGQDLRGGLQ